MAEIQDEKERKELYRLLLSDPATRNNTAKYSFKQWENKMLGDEENLSRVADYAVKQSWALDKEDFLYKYAPEKVAPAPKPQAAPVAPAPVEEEPYVPEPQPAIGSPKYDAQLQAQYGGMSPTLGATFGGAPAAFETKAQKKQEQISPAFKAQQLAFEDVPIAEEQRRSQRQFAKATKQQQQAALMGGPGFEVEQKKRKKERGYGEWGEDVVGSWVEGGKRIGKNILSTVGYFAQTQAATDPMANLPYEKRQEMMQQASQTMYDNATAAQNTFQNEIAKRNIQTSVLQAINKGDYSRLPESVLYTVGDAAMQIIPSILTFGGSTYAQTLPQVYKDGVDAIAKEKGISPEQAIANGDDAFVVSQINAGVQSALEYAGAGLVSKGIASKGGYKAMRDWLLSQNVNRKLAQGAALLGVGIGEGTTEYFQEMTGQAGKTAAKSPTAKAFFEKIPNEIFTPEARRQREEAFVGGLVGGLGLAGGGQAIQSAMDRTLFEAPKIGKATQRADYDVVQTDNKIQERNKIAQAMEEAVKANPEAEGQIRQQYQKLINEAAPKDEEVLSSYESLSVLPETEEKNAIRESLEAYMAEKGLQPQPAGIDAGLGELMRRGTPVIETVNPDFPPPIAPTEEAPAEEVTPATGMFQGIAGPQAEDELGFVDSEEIQLTPEERAALLAQEETAPAAPAIAPLNIDFTKNEGRNVNYQGIEGRVKIDSDGAPYVFTKDGDVVYIEGGLSGQTPQQLGVQPLADDVINEADVETVLQDENAPLDQNQLEYDFDNNTVTLYGKPFTYEGVETNSKGQTTALRLRDANGKVKFVRNEDTILEFEIQKELYEKSRTNKPATIESATAAAQQLQVVPVARIEQVPEPVQQEGPVGDIESDEVAPSEDENVIVEPDSELFQKILDNGEQVLSRLDAEKRIGDGERLFGFNEQDDSLVELSLQNLGAFPIDTIIAVRPEVLSEEVPAEPIAPEAAPETPAPAAPKKEEAPKPEPKKEEEAQQEPRAAQKIAAISPTNLQVFKGVVTKDPLRTKLQGVYFDKANQKIVATDGMNMVVISRDVKSDVVINPKTGQVIKEAFPDYQTVIPTDYTKSVRNVSINDILGKLDAIIKGDKERTENAFATITFDGEQVGITPKVLKAGLKALKDLGYETASIEYQNPKKPLLIKTKDGKTLLLTMPTFLREDKAEGAISIGEFALEDTGKPKAEPAPAPETKEGKKAEAKEERG